jgi:hypothetical protein
LIGKTLHIHKHHTTTVNLKSAEQSKRRRERGKAEPDGWFNARVPEDTDVFLELTLDRDVAEIKPDVLIICCRKLRPLDGHELLWAATWSWWWRWPRVDIVAPRPTASVVGFTGVGVGHFDVVASVKKAGGVFRIPGHLPGPAHALWSLLHVVVAGVTAFRERLVVIHLPCYYGGVAQRDHVSTAGQRTWSNSVAASYESATGWAEERHDGLHTSEQSNAQPSVAGYSGTMIAQRRNMGGRR